MPQNNLSVGLTESASCFFACYVPSGNVIPFIGYSASGPLLTRQNEFSVFHVRLAGFWCEVYKTSFFINTNLSLELWCIDKRKGIDKCNKANIKSATPLKPKSIIRPLIAILPSYKWLSCSFSLLCTPSCAPLHLAIARYAFDEALPIWYTYKRK